MGLGDTLERLFSIEQEVTIESAILEFVRAGDNFKSKTNLPLHKSSSAVSLLEQLGSDMDDEFSEILYYVNRSMDIPLKVKGKPNPDLERPSKFINDILIEAMILEPSIKAESRKELLQAIKFRQEVDVRRRDDTLTKINEWIQR